MKKIVSGLILCLLSMKLNSSEQIQFENDKICVLKATTSSEEEVNFHNEIYPQVVIPLRESVISRLDENGRVTKIKLSPGQTLYCNPDEEQVTHSTGEPLDFIIIRIKDISPSLKNEKDSYDISVEIKLNCPMSKELKSFASSMPPKGNYTSSYDLWKISFRKNMEELIHLVESEKVFHSWWSVKTDGEN